MLTIRSLNRDSVTEEDVPTIRKEAQEEIALDMYNNALRLQIQGTYDEAKTVLQKLLDENIPQLESQGGLPKTMSTLKYSCYYNLGNIAVKEEDSKSALDNYLLAADLDTNNVTLWHKIGMLSLKLDKFRQAINAFMQGLKCSESHWPCLDQLIMLLFVIKDTIACLFYIGKAFSINSEYMRGHVLRKQIYQNNPAAEEYFRLHSPDAFADTNFYIPISEEDEACSLEDVKKLLVRINAIEDAMKTKPLPRIDLPKPLQTYTWVSLGDSIIDLHKYITNAKLSHLCQVTLIQNIASTNDPPSETPQNIVEDDKIQENKPDVLEPVFRNELLENVERRMSVNSENNTDENFTSSQAEDNDEMDQDTEDQEEKVEKKQAKKRQRDLLLDLQIWGWHSKRVKSCKKTKVGQDCTIEGALKKIIPAHLLQSGLKPESLNHTEDSMNTVDMYENQVEKDDTSLLPIDFINSNPKETYFGSRQEKDDVIKFWNKFSECCNAVTLIEEFVNTLATLWQFKWPDRLPDMYIEAYYMYREHLEHPPLFHSNIPFEELRNDALATLLFGELYHYRNISIDGEPIHPTSLVFLQLISTWDHKWEDEYISFAVRVHWLRAHIYRKHSETTLAIRSLQLVSQTLPKEDGYRLHFPNFTKYPYVAPELVDKLLKHLEMVESISHLEDLYNSEKYTEVAEIVKTTFMCIGNPATCGKMGRPAQLGVLMHSLWFLNKEECFIWTEKCLHEAVRHSIKNWKSDNKWDLVLDKCVQILREIIKEETVCVVDSLTPEHRCRLIENLCSIVCYQVNKDDVQNMPLNSVTTWIVLHYVLLREEQRSQASKCISRTRRRYSKSIYDHSKDVPSSIAILFVAHEFLGPKGRCMTSQGELLHFIIDTILDRLEMPVFERLREKIDIHLEQAFFCLYQHFSKKNKVSRHLADHNVSPLSLTWERAQQIYDFYYPSRDALPEYDSFKSFSISSDLEQLLQRIIALVPSECDPIPFTSKVSDFVYGNASDLPAEIAFPFKMRGAYYLLGDYYFKQRESARSMKYFYADICINPTRLDTWADLALGMSSELEIKLNHCERFKNENEFLEKVKSAEICFTRALALVDIHISLWIEFGTFQYMAHSYCSRVLKYESDTFSMDKFETLESKKEDYLNNAGKCFSKVLDLYQSEQSVSDERWLQYYMLGKVAEKHRKEPVDYLEHYLSAAALLNENNATYPDKINYHNPQRLSIEALEIYYRIHAAVLKYLELHEGKPILSSTGKMFIKCFDTLNLCETTSKLTEVSPTKPEKPKSDDLDDIILQCVEHLLSEVEKQSLSEQESLEKGKNSTNETAVTSKIPECVNKKKQQIRKSIDETSSASSSSSENSSSDSDSDDSSSSSSSSSSETPSNAVLTDTEVNDLLNRCIIGLEKCVQRFPQNYKALFRLVHFYFYYGSRKDISKCKQLLLGEYKCKNEVSISGLFSDHKPTNFFNGVWRIPSSEIDRPGSLAAHMARCVTILLQVLRQSNEHKVLLEVFLQLRRTPDADKIYIRHLEREQLAEQAISSCIQALRTQIKNVTANSAIQKLLLDTYKSYQRIQKHVPNKESVFATVLTDVYKKFAQKQIPENANILDLALKFCQQHKASEKLKQQQQQLQKQTTTAPPTPTVITPTPPVLPTPQSATPTNVNIPLKRPTIGRPRGRPPGPKLPAMYTSLKQRTDSKSNPAWSNMMYEQDPMKYMLEYQKELLRQYNQFTMNRYSNFTNQFAPSNSSTPLLKTPNSNQLLNTMATSSPGFNPLALNTLSPTFNQINPSLVKKLMEHGASTQQSKTWSSKTANETKPAYTTANFNKSPQLSTFKYNTVVGSEKLQKPRSTLIDFSSSEGKKSSPPTDYVASSIASKRPNLTVIPVNTLSNTTSSLPMKPVVTTAGKTLQEKLADKQKQLNKNMSLDRKGNAKGKRRIVSTSQPSSSSHVKLPTFSLESGVSISQVQTAKTRPSSDQQRAHKDSGTKTLNIPALSRNKLAISEKKLKDNSKRTCESLDDDIIIIE